MAGDWIPIDVNIHSKPKVLRIAKLIDRSPHEVVGMLVACWSWAQAHTADGLLPEMDAAMIAAAAHVPEAFVLALAEVGWLAIDETGCLISNWDEWFSGGAKARVQARRRVARYRVNMSRQSPHNGSPDDVTHERYTNARTCNAVRVTARRADDAPIDETHAQQLKHDTVAHRITDDIIPVTTHSQEHSTEQHPTTGSTAPCKPGGECNASVTHERYESARICNAEALPEKRREEKRIKEDSPPRSPPRQRGGEPTEELGGVTYPEGCDTPQVRQALVDWLAYRRRIGKPYRDPAKQLSLLLARYGSAVTDAIQHSIAQGYQGAFLPRDGPTHEKPRRPTIDELLTEAASAPLPSLLSHWREEPQRAPQTNSAPNAGPGELRNSNGRVRSPPGPQTS